MQWVICLKSEDWFSLRVEFTVKHNQENDIFLCSSPHFKKEFVKLTFKL